MNFSTQVIAFTRALRPPDIALPPGFEWLYPYDQPETMRAPGRRSSESVRRSKVGSDPAARKCAPS